MNVTSFTGLVKVGGDFTKFKVLDINTYQIILQGLWKAFFSSMSQLSTDVKKRYCHSTHYRETVSFHGIQ